MPLSEDEQRQLDRIERDLVRQHPEFAGHLDRGQRRRVILAAALLGVGLILLLVGVVATQSAATLGVIISGAGMLAIIATLAVYLRS